jgi:hypothetical protein
VLDKALQCEVVWGVEANSHAFVTSALHGSEYSASHTNSFTPGERATVSFGPQSHSGRGDRGKSLPGIELLISSPKTVTLRTLLMGSYKISVLLELKLFGFIVFRCHEQCTLIISHIRVQQTETFGFKAIYVVNSFERHNSFLNCRDYIEPNKVAMNDGQVNIYRRRLLRILK